MTVREQGRAHASRQNADRGCTGQCPSNQCPANDRGWLRVWRPEGTTGLVAIHSRTSAYQAEPHGEYVFGYLNERSIEVRRDHERYLVRPGDLLLWDPSGPHRGAAVDGGYFESRAVVVEVATVAEVVADPEGCTLDVEFPNPVLRDPHRARAFLRLHRALTEPASTLEREVGLFRWLHELTRLGPDMVQHRRRENRRSARRSPALRRACQLLRDDLANDLDLAALAAAAGTSKFRLLRLFKAGLGLPPYEYQIQLRVQRARALLESGEPVASVAHHVGFYDQSHLSRHFQRRFGVPPGCYARGVAAGRRQVPDHPCSAARSGDDAAVA